MTEHSSLAAALAAFQAEIPHIGKPNTAMVKSDKGSYKYAYADLSDISVKVLPVLAKHGLSFSSKPTLDESGKFVLEYTLRHASGESDSGRYPLGSGTPQQMGSAITYGRRYTLCAVTGVAPDEDDDGAAASNPVLAQAQQPVNGNGQQQLTEADVARATLRKTCGENGWNLTVVAGLFEDEHGVTLKEATAISVIDKFRESLFKRPQAELAAVPA